jgi:hypothetical protein
MRTELMGLGIDSDFLLFDREVISGLLLDAMRWRVALSVDTLDFY